jgi:phosphopentomutase
MLAAGPGVRAGADIGSRKTFADIGATVAEHLAVPSLGGTSFLGAIRRPEQP